MDYNGIAQYDVYSNAWKRFCSTFFSEGNVDQSVPSLSTSKNVKICLDVIIYEIYSFSCLNGLFMVVGNFASLGDYAFSNVALCSNDGIQGCTNAGKGVQDFAEGVFFPFQNNAVECNGLVYISYFSTSGMTIIEYDPISMEWNFTYQNGNVQYCQEPQGLGMACLADTLYATIPLSVGFDCRASVQMYSGYNWQTPAFAENVVVAFGPMDATEDTLCVVNLSTNCLND